VPTCNTALASILWRQKEKAADSTSAAVLDKNRGYGNVTKVIWSWSLIVCNSLFLSDGNIAHRPERQGSGLPSAIAAGTAVDPNKATTLNTSTITRRAFFM
jgi:hypothetical protein